MFKLRACKQSRQAALQNHGTALYRREAAMFGRQACKQRLKALLFSPGTRKQNDGAGLLDHQQNLIAGKSNLFRTKQNLIQAEQNAENLLGDELNLWRPPFTLRIFV